MNDRIIEIDFVKGVLISLMIVFHLTVIVEAYESLRNWVYCFHMSGFLVISGFFHKKSRDSRQITKAIRRILIPYLIFELLYLFGISLFGSILQSSNQLDLSLSALCHNLFSTPIGTYWYLHTLFLCVVVFFVFDRICKNSLTSWLLSGSVLFVMTLYINGLSWGNVIYFLMGNLIYRLNLKIIKIIVPSIWSVIPIVLISYFAPDLDRNNLTGVALSFLMMSFIMALFRFLPTVCKNIGSYLGRNSLCIVLFSPIFTVFTKFYSPLFDFDSTHILYAIFSLSLVIGLCLLCAWICDKLNISKIICGNILYNKYNMNDKSANITR